MEGLIVFVVLCATLWGLYLGIKFSLRAFRDPGNRANDILSAAGGFLLAGFLSYPAFLGPIVARVACSSGVGFTMAARSDLRSNGYLVDWPANVDSSLMPQAVEDLLVGRIAFFETSSYGRDGSLQHFSLAPDDSRDCINPRSLTGDRQLPPGKCLALRSVQARISNYDIETSPGYWRHDAFEKKIALVERANARSAASYTFRRIPMARVDFGGNSSVICPNESVTARHAPWYGLTTNALIANQAAAALLDVKQKPKSCELPPLPENVELHRYASDSGARRRADIDLEAGRLFTTENDVFVNRPHVPVILWLRNRDPVLWRIHQAPDSQVIAVIAEGDGAVAVTGVKASVPLLISSTNYGRMSNCRTLEADKQLSRLNIQLTSDVKGDKVYATRRETIPFVIGPKLSADKYEESGDITESQYALAR